MKILLAIDESACSWSAIDMIAREFAGRQMDVLVLHAIEWPGELPTYLTMNESAVAVPAILEARQELVAAAESLVARAAADLRGQGFNVTTRVVEGRAVAEVVRAAEDWGADLIAMGSHGRRGFQRLLLGSVAEGVLRRAPCSVEIVRTPEAVRAA